TEGDGLAVGGESQGQGRSERHLLKSPRADVEELHLSLGLAPGRDGAVRRDGGEAARRHIPHATAVAPARAEVPNHVLARTRSHQRLTVRGEGELIAGVTRK